MSALKLRFRAEGGKETIRLIELSHEKLLKAIENLEPLYIRGNETDNAVLCSEMETFRLNEISTSNLILVNEKVCENESMILGTPSTILEATPLMKPPGIDQLLEELHKFPFESGFSAQVSEKLHVDQIFRSIQASNLEIKNCLESVGALIIDDHYRILGCDLSSRFFDLILNTATIEDWNLFDSLDFGVVWEAFKQYEDEFSENTTFHILKFYSKPSKDKDCIILDRVKISRFYARQLLKMKKGWKLDQFVEAWEGKTGDLTPNINEISDLILKEIHPGNGSVEVHRFFKDELPSDVDKRFIALFKTRQRWIFEELVPFINDLAKDQKEIDAIVLRHGRVSTSDGIKYVTPRSQLLD